MGSSRAKCQSLNPQKMGAVLLAAIVLYGGQEVPTWCSRSKPPMLIADGSSTRGTLPTPFTDTAGVHRTQPGARAHRRTRARRQTRHPSRQFSFIRSCLLSDSRLVSLRCEYHSASMRYQLGRLGVHRRRAYELSGHRVRLQNLRVDRLHPYSHRWVHHVYSGFWTPGILIRISLHSRRGLGVSGLNQ